MRNENRAVFDRTSERYDYAFELPLTSKASDDSDHETTTPAVSRTAFDRLILFVLGKLRQRRNRNALLELTDDQLKDIGVSRSQAYGDHSNYRRNGAHGIERKCL